MYLEFFGLKQNPFSLVSDPHFLFYSDGHCEAMAHLLYGVRERKGVILMLGEAGTGKTTLVRATLDMLRSTRVTAGVIFNPILGKQDDLLAAILASFGVERYERNAPAMAASLQAFLEEMDAEGHIPVLIVDEAQELEREMLEQIRLISNFERDGHKLLQIVLAAQPEMGERLDSYEMRALRQRVVVRSRLGALTPMETWRYMGSRVARAGGDTHEIFTPAAGAVIHHFSGGVPRLVNTLADNCLLAAYAKGITCVQPALVEQAARHLEMRPLEKSNGNGNGIRHDVIRASSTWKEVVEDLRSGTVPQALRQFVENMRAPDEVFAGMERGA